MRMNKTNYKQYDTRWAKLGYPKAPHYIKACGCGEVAICNSIIEMDAYKNQTPKTIQPYCKQFAAPNGNGTYFSGIPTMMKHYGMTEVQEHQTMAPLWKELAKGGRVAIYLMGNRKGGSKKVHWTSSAHFVCSTDYKYENGKHWLYVKDSNSTSNQRNGWIAYEDNMRNDVSRVWSGKLKVAVKAPVAAVSKPVATVQTPQDKMVAWAKKMAASAYHYVNFNTGKKAHECPICHKHAKGKYYGGNCIWFAFASWHHGAGLKSRCSCEVFSDAIYEKMLTAPMKEFLKLARERTGLKSLKVIRNKSGIDPKKLQPGDIVVYFNGSNYVHTALWVGDGKIADCTSAREDSIKYGVTSYTKWEIKLAIRYTGK